ncbi:MAG: DUF1360 domain-containing protein [Solirubrobacteraceae bacterium]
MGSAEWMPTGRTDLQDVAPFRGHAPDQHRPLGGYAMLMGTYLTLSGAFALWWRSTGRELPERVSAGDLALVTVATHKAARLAARDRVTATLRAPFTSFQQDAGPGEVDEAARGSGLRRAIGELLVCPYCMDMWFATAFLAGLIAAPAAARWVASSFAVLTGADVLQVAYKKAESLL